MSGTSGRLLSLLSLLQARRDWPGQLLAQRLEVSPRTVRRDVDRLRELGYPVQATMGPDGGYCLAAGAELPPLLFDDEQAVALTVALQLAVTSGAGIADAAWRALGTVRQVMPARLRARVDSMQVLGMPPAGATEVDPAVLVAVTTAVQAQQVLHFDYRTSAEAPDRDADPPRRVEPLHVIVRAGRWYLLAWDLDRTDWRTFRVDRMTPRSPTGPRFTPRAVPGDDITAFVTARFRGLPDASRGTGWPCQGDVVVRLPLADVAPYVADGAAEAVSPDRTRVTMGAYSWIGLAASFARLDAELEVVGPAELTQAFADLAARCAATSSGGPGPSISNRVRRPS